jgi:hypothetical protein
MKEKYLKMLEDAEEKQFDYSGAWVAHQEATWSEVQRLIKKDEEMSDKPYTITDKRGLEKGQETPNEVCRVCGSQEVHSKKYGKPTMECIKYLKNQVSELQEYVTVDEAYHDETGPI